jgi:hypothetical protein
VICPKHTPDIGDPPSLSSKRIHGPKADIHLTAPPIYRDVGERWRNASLGIRRLKTRRRLETIPHPERSDAMINAYGKSPCSSAASAATALILLVVLAMAGSLLIDAFNSSSPASAVAQNLVGRNA